VSPSSVTKGKMTSFNTKMPNVTLFEYFSISVRPQKVQILFLAKMTTYTYSYTIYMYKISGESFLHRGTGQRSFSFLQNSSVPLRGILAILVSLSPFFSFFLNTVLHDLLFRYSVLISIF
jgi:hypothetical protein